MRIPDRFHRGHDAWGRGCYTIPGAAVLGASDTGPWPDSPCPSDDVVAELNLFRKVLRQAGIKSRWAFTRMGLFTAKRWVSVAAADWERAAELADRFLRERGRELEFTHDARG